MRYQGGKTKQCRYIVPIIHNCLKLNPDSSYVEPFIGGGSIFTNVKHSKKIGGDIDSDVIDMWKYFKEGNKVPDHNLITKELYTQLKDEYKTGKRTHPSWMYAFVGNACSYGGKKWGGYASINPIRQENHIKEACVSTQRQIDEGCLEGDLYNVSYDKLPIPEKSVIYCDPPYRGTLGYGNGFDHDAFWQWCREQAKRGCKVFVSEYSAPSDFKCIWKKRKKDGMGTTKTGHKQKTKVEKLYFYGN